MDPLREQYERFPYPPVSSLALPAADEGERLSFERGMRYCYGKTRSHRGINILVVGAGTFEAAVVAQAHPFAREVVALDFSAASLKILKRRLLLARFTRKLPPVRCICADLNEWPGEKFDYIVASNVLHHLPNPVQGLEKLAKLLTPDGVLRLVTYPRSSRIFMRQASAWLKLSGFCDRKSAHAAMALLPAGHPARVIFEDHEEIHSEAGFRDAFCNARENPLSPLDWRAACSRAALLLKGEDQNETSTSQFLVDLLPATANLDRWERLQVLDDALEMCSNPILWLCPGTGPSADCPAKSEQIHPQIESFLANRDNNLRLPSVFRLELARNFRRADAILSKVSLSLTDLVSIIREKVGPRVTAPPEEAPLPGLSILDYDVSSILQFENEARELRTPRLSPREIEKLLGPEGEKKLSRAQLRHGPLTNWIDLQPADLESDFPPRL